jgi:hypothetical protein
MLKLLAQIRNPKPVDDFVEVDERLRSDNPTQLLHETGVGVGFLTLRSKTCDNILNHLMRILRKQEYTTNVEGLSSPMNRLDVELPPHGYCWMVLQRILTKWTRDPKSPWHRFKKRGVEPQIVEFSILGSTPGSKNQLWHKDHWGGYGKLISFGIPLIDVQDIHGPTECIPKNLNQKKYKRKPFRIRARRGQLYAWDGGMTHRGTKNSSNMIRPIFMFSLSFSKKIPTPIDELSLHPDLAKRLLQ